MTLRHTLENLLVATIVLAACGAARGQQVERFLTYKVPRIAAEAAPTIDGVLDDKAWQGRAAIDTLRIFLGKGAGDFATQPSSFVFLHDGRNVYIGATFHEQSMETIRANPAKHAFWNDCIEVYFDPRHDGTRAIQLVVSCIGQTHQIKRVNEGFGWYDDSAWTMLADWQSAVRRNKTNWTVEIRLNARAFDIDTAAGNVVGANVCRFRFAGQADELTAWTFGPRIRKLQKDMSSWGHLIFSDKPEVSQEVTMEEVRTVYPDLGDRVLQVPAEGGFRLFTSEGARKVSFRDLLKPLVDRTTAAAKDAANALTRLDEAKVEHAALSRQLVDLQKQLDAGLAELRVDHLGQGLYDRSTDRLAALNERFVELTWQARLKLLVNRAQADTKP